MSSCHRTLTPDISLSCSGCAEFYFGPTGLRLYIGFVAFKNFFKKLVFTLLRTKNNLDFM
jgi:hypothetical protein